MSSWVRTWWGSIAITTISSSRNSSLLSAAQRGAGVKTQHSAKDRQQAVGLTSVHIRGVVGVAVQPHLVGGLAPVRRHVLLDRLAAHHVHVLRKDHLRVGVHLAAQRVLLHRQRIAIRQLRLIDRGRGLGRDRLLCHLVRHVEQLDRREHRRSHDLDHGVFLRLLERRQHRVVAVGLVDADLVEVAVAPVLRLALHPGGGGAGLLIEVLRQLGADLVPGEPVLEVALGLLHQTRRLVDRDLRAQKRQHGVQLVHVDRPLRVDIARLEGKGQVAELVVGELGDVLRHFAGRGRLRRRLSVRAFLGLQRGRPVPRGARRDGVVVLIAILGLGCHLVPALWHLPYPPECWANALDGLRPDGRVRELLRSPRPGGASDAPSPEPRALARASRCAAAVQP